MTTNKGEPLPSSDIQPTADFKRELDAELDADLDRAYAGIVLAFYITILI